MDRRYYKLTDSALECARLANVVCMNRANNGSANYIEYVVLDDIQGKLDQIEKSLQGLIEGQIEERGQHNSNV